MKKIFTYSFLVISILAGCQVKELEAEISTEQEVLPARDSKPFVAIIEDDSVGNETKTTLDNSGNVLWKQGDQVSVFAGSTVNEHYQVSNSSDGKTHATLYKIPDDGFVAGTDIDNNVAFYPFASTASVAKSGDGYVISDIKLLATQNYATGSFGNGAFPMAAITSSIEDMNLQFKNVLGGLKLQLKGTATITSITVTGNNNEILCGDAEVTTTYGGVPSIALSDASAKTVTFDCGAGVPLDSETATPFIIALPPMTMTGGFTVVVTDSESKQMEIKTTKPQTISRSNLLKMPAVDYVGEVTQKTPLKFTSTGSTSISLTKTGSPAAISLEYKLDADEWISYTVGDAIALTDGQELSFRAGAGGNASFSQSTFNYYKFTVTGSGTVAASGNIMSLLNREGGLTIPNTFCFYMLFNKCTSLTTAPELPATTLAKNCYQGMFNGCTSLTTAPELPATTLAQSCYSGMFSGCTSLTTAPELPAITLAKWCYSSMFSGCTSLTTAPELPATTLAQNCYSAMFSGCTSLTTAPELPATALTLADRCYESMFYGCSELTTVPSKLPATTLAKECYYRMFSGCTSLTNAPELPATALSELCYEDMFYGCTSLTTAPKLPATTLASECYFNMFSGCTSLTTAPELPATTLAQNCYSAMFSGCTSLTTAPELPATTLAEACYGSMFKGCTSLTTAPVLPAITLAKWCYSGMFSGCTSLTTAPELPATTLAELCYQEMFSGCTSLTTAPELPAITLAKSCYINMFSGCTSLTTAPVLPATTLAQGCYNYMFNGCIKLNYIKALFTTTPSSTYTYRWVTNVSATGTFVKNSSATWDAKGEHGVPSGWTVLTAITTPEVVDLGLSVKWATFDLGAEYEGDFGDAYSWGELEPWTESTTWQDYSYGSAPNVLPLSDDVANVKLGGNWRMPTEEETKELVANCTVSYETVNSVSCLKLTSKKNGQSIYLPRYRFYNSRILPEQGDASYFWTSSIYASYTGDAVFYGYDSNHTSNPIDHYNRYGGFAIRPVSSDNSGGSQTVNNEPVDLGLSVKWASCNLGANSPEEYGDYYAWGETELENKWSYSWDNYKWCNGSNNSLTKYNTSSSLGTVDNKTTLEGDDDVAHIELGGNWRMPTYAEYNELLTQCTWANSTRNGVNGKLVTGENGNSIFIPKAGWKKSNGLSEVGTNGYYWTSSLYTDDNHDDYAWCVKILGFDSYDIYDYFTRCSGLTIRPVID